MTQSAVISGIGKKILAEEVENDESCFIKKVLKLENGEVVVRLNNGVIQLHFNDLTSLFLNR